MTAVTVRFTGTRLDSFAAFVTAGDTEARVSLDPDLHRPWKCQHHGRQTSPHCVHTDAVDAANRLRETTT